jgi:hypothetical protein
LTRNARARRFQVKIKILSIHRPHTRSPAHETTRPETRVIVKHGVVRVRCDAHRDRGVDDDVDDVAAKRRAAASELSADADADADADAASRVAHRCRRSRERG